MYIDGHTSYSSRETYTPTGICTGLGVRVGVEEAAAVPAAFVGRAAFYSSSRRFPPQNQAITHAHANGAWRCVPHCPGGDVGDGQTHHHPVHLAPCAQVRHLLNSLVPPPLCGQHGWMCDRCGRSPCSSRGRVACWALTHALQSPNEFSDPFVAERFFVLPM